MLQRLPIALAQVKAGNTCENLLHKIRQSYILCIEQKKLLKKCNELLKKCNEFNKGMIQKWIIYLWISKNS